MSSLRNTTCDALIVPSDFEYMHRKTCFDLFNVLVLSQIYMTYDIKHGNNKTLLFKLKIYIDRLLT